VPVYTGNGLGVVPLAVAALGLLLYTLFAPGWAARRDGGARPGDPGDRDAAGWRPVPPVAGTAANGEAAPPAPAGAPPRPTGPVPPPPAGPAARRAPSPRR
jgi:hypothetical protein